MNYFITLALALWVYMSVWFIISVIKKRNDVADIAWGLGFVFIAGIALYGVGELSVRGILVQALVSIWGIRLAWHIYVRHIGRPEDYRYLNWRNTWGVWFYPRSYLQVYVLQGVCLYLIALPLMLVMRFQGPVLGVYDICGISIWLIGFCFEVIGDAQLARFIKNPTHEGKLMQSGLWAYTRHPNYFGEATMWWGMWIVALSVPGGWLGVIGPITITYLLLNVSGVPMLEKKMAINPEFAAYAARVSMFIPLPPRTVRGDTTVTK